MIIIFLILCMFNQQLLCADDASLHNNLTYRLHPGHYEGEHAPLFSLPDEKNIMHALSEYREKKVLLLFFNYKESVGIKFFSDKCDVMEYMRYLLDLNAWLLVNNIHVICVTNALNDQIAWMKSTWKLPFLMLHETGRSVATIYGATNDFGEIIQTTLLINEKGIVQKAFQHKEAVRHIAHILMYILVNSIL